MLHNGIPSMTGAELDQLKPRRSPRASCSEPTTRSSAAATDADRGDPHRRSQRTPSSQAGTDNDLSSNQVAAAIRLHYHHSRSWGPVTHQVVTMD